MVDGTLLTLNLTGGFSVLLGYTFVTLTKVGSKLYKIFTKNERTIFLTLTFLSIISFFYLLYWACFTDSLQDWRSDLYLESLAIYLFGASIWSPVIYSIVSNKQNPNRQIPALFITASGTIGMLVAVASETNNQNLSYSFAMIAAILLVFQHAGFDLFYWSTIHAKRKSSYR